MGTYFRLNKMRLEELHRYEQPIALQTAMQANYKRDSKTRKKPFESSDFYVFQPADQQDKPSARYAAAYQKMLADKELPRWALFVFSSLRNEEGATCPTPHYLRGDGVLLLAPRWSEGIVEGMLIATERPAGAMELVDPDGDRHMCIVPAIETKIVAQEQTEIRLLQ